MRRSLLTSAGLVPWRAAGVAQRHQAALHAPLPPFSQDADGLSRGFGFVSFAAPAAAAAAVVGLNGKELDGKVVFAGRAQKRTEREASLRAKLDEVGRSAGSVAP